jgi:aminopeptidase-like protein
MILLSFVFIVAIVVVVLLLKKYRFKLLTEQNEIVDIAQRTGLRVQQINDVFDSIKLEQGVLDDEKQKAGENMKILGEKLNALKRELYSIEEAITGFKSLS